jgi:hypothetical protein
MRFRQKMDIKHLRRQAERQFRGTLLPDYEAAIGQYQLRGGETFGRYGRHDIQKTGKRRYSADTSLLFLTRDVGLCLMCSRFDYQLAIQVFRDGLRFFPDDVVLLYSLSIALVANCYTIIEVKGTPLCSATAIEEATTLLHRAKAIDAAVLPQAAATNPFVSCWAELADPITNPCDTIGGAVSLARGGGYSTKARFTSVEKQKTFNEEPGQCFKSFEERYFRAAVRAYPDSSLAWMNYAIMLHSIPYLSRLVRSPSPQHAGLHWRPLEWRRVAIQRATKRYEKAIELDRSRSDPHLLFNHMLYEQLWSRELELVPYASRTRKLNMNAAGMCRLVCAYTGSMLLLSAEMNKGDMPECVTFSDVETRKQREIAELREASQRRRQTEHDDEDFMQEDHEDEPLSIEEVAKGTKVFGQIDKDGSGSISTSELRRAMKAMGREVARAEMEVLMAQVDGDSSGHLDKDEFLELIRLQLVHKRREEKEQKRRETEQKAEEEEDRLRCKRGERQAGGREAEKMRKSVTTQQLQTDGVTHALHLHTTYVMPDEIQFLWAPREDPDVIQKRELAAKMRAVAQARAIKSTGGAPISEERQRQRDILEKKRQKRAAMRKKASVVEVTKELCDTLLSAVVRASCTRMGDLTDRDEEIVHQVQAGKLAMKKARLDRLAAEKEAETGNGLAQLGSAKAEPMGKRGSRQTLAVMGGGGRHLEMQWALEQKQKKAEVAAAAAAEAKLTAKDGGVKLLLKRQVLRLLPVWKERAKLQHDFDKVVAVRKLQRCTQGFFGRSLWSRMRAQEMTRLKQRKHLESLSEQRAFVRRFRYRCLSLIQARIRGILYRKRLAELTANQIKVAARYRGYRTRKMLHENSQRLRLGPEVHRVYKRGHLLTGAVSKYLLVEIFACGNSYRFVGHDMEELAEYQGFVSGSELRERLQERVKKKGPLGYIPLWNKPKVCEYIISQLSVVSPIGALSQEMRKMDLDYVLVMDPRLGPNTSGEGVQAKRIESNILKDQHPANEFRERKVAGVEKIVERRYKAGKHQRRVAEMMERLKKDKMSALKRVLGQHNVNFTQVFCTQELLKDVEKQRYEVEKMVVHLRMMERWEKKATQEPIAELKKVSWANILLSNMLLSRDYYARPNLQSSLSYSLCLLIV